MKKIFIDYDSTLVDFLTPFLEYINSKKDTNLTVENFEEEENYAVYKNFMNDFYKGKEQIDFNEVYGNIDIFEKSVSFLNSLISSGYEIHLVTSSMKGQKSPKIEHIDTHFKELITNVIHARKKFTHTTDGIFMDDSVKHVEAHCENNKTLGILFNYEGMHNYDTDKIKELEEKYDNFKYITEYDEILEILEIKTVSKNKKEIKQKDNTPTL